MVCGIQKPHVPYWAPQKYFDMYPPEKIEVSVVPKNDWDDIPTTALVKRYTAFGFEAAKENDSLRREYMQAYHACITFVDTQIGLILDSLEKNGLENETIVVLTSDHGYHLGEHFLWGKVTLFEVCARVPMVVRVPGRTPANSHTTGLVELVDLFPTLCDLCGIDTPEEMQGESFAAVLEDPKSSGKQLAYSVVSRGQKLGSSIRTSRWRYAEWNTPEENELYDLDQDPSEFDNLSKDPGMQKVVNQLRKALREKQAEAASLR